MHWKAILNLNSKNKVEAIVFTKMSIKSIIDRSDGILCRIIFAVCFDECNEKYTSTRNKEQRWSNEKKEQTGQE